jgi:hypothetical protein
MGSRNPDFEGKKMKKAKKVPAKRRSAGPTKAAPFRVKLGGYYQDGEKKLIGPIVKTPKGYPYEETHPFKDSNGLRTYTAGGRFFPAIGSPMDLIREVPAPKPPKRGKA